jgi:pimeloyl-ACP methyl ester carboxylesterase
MHPHFRGANNKPEATGSDLVVGDITSAVAYASSRTAIDDSSVYLVGTSGGGYTALVMAGRHPALWAGVSAWVPISDLEAWYYQCKEKQWRYYRDIATACGGAPGDSPEVDREYRQRSPLTFLHNARGRRLHIHAGIYDYHQGSVPVSHSLLAFNEVAADEDTIAQEDIRFFVDSAAVPPHLQHAPEDSSYGGRQPLFRRRSGHATVTVFNGGHDLVAPAAIAWIDSLQRTK